MQESRISWTLIMPGVQAAEQPPDVAADNSLGQVIVGDIASGQLPVARSVCEFFFGASLSRAWLGEKTIRFLKKI